MRTLLRRFQFLFNRRRHLDDLEAEMRLHRELRAELLAQQGIAADEATHTANRQFGNTTLLKEDSHYVLAWNLLEDLFKDLRYALRSLFANRLFAVIAVITLALGIGANTAIFSVINAVLLRGLPVAKPEQLVYLHVEPGQPDGAFQTGNNGDSSFSEYVFEQLRTQHQAFSTVAAYVPLGLIKLRCVLGCFPKKLPLRWSAAISFRASEPALPAGTRLTSRTKRTTLPSPFSGMAFGIAVSAPIVR